MKKFFIGFLIGFFLTVSIPAMAENINVAINTIKIMVNGNFIKQPTISYNNTTYIPLRAVSESLGANVSWDEATQTASISLNNNISINPTFIPAESESPKKDYDKILKETQEKEQSKYYIESIKKVITNNTTYDNAFIIVKEDKYSNVIYSYIKKSVVLTIFNEYSNEIVSELKPQTINNEEYYYLANILQFLKYKGKSLRYTRNDDNVTFVLN